MPKKLSDANSVVFCNRDLDTWQCWDSPSHDGTSTLINRYSVNIQTVSRCKSKFSPLERRLAIAWNPTHFPQRFFLLRSSFTIHTNTDCITTILQSEFLFYNKRVANIDQFNLHQQVQSGHVWFPWALIFRQGLPVTLKAQTWHKGATSFFHSHLPPFFMISSDESCALLAWKVLVVCINFGCYEHPRQVILFLDQVGIWKRRMASKLCLVRGLRFVIVGLRMRMWIWVSDTTALCWPNWSTDRLHWKIA